MTSYLKITEILLRLSPRISQIILVPKNTSTVVHNTNIFGPIYSNYNNIIELMNIQNKIESLNCFNGSYGCLRNICYKPLHPDNNNCLVLSVAEYFKKNSSNVKQSNWLKKLDTCLTFPMRCIAMSGIPIENRFVVGTGPHGRVKSDLPNYPSTDQIHRSARSFIITFVNQNFFAGDKRLEECELWEQSFIKFLTNYNSSVFDIYYNSERSPQDGIDQISKTDVSIVLLSYLVMLIYLTIFLTSFTTLSTLLIDIKASLGISCICMIILSLTSSFGFFSLIGIDTTLIVLEVTPFLILAIGSGDIFIFVKSFHEEQQKQKENITIENLIKINLQHVGPSLLLSSSAQFIAFMLGAALVPVSAVSVFALYSGFAVFVKFCLQMTFFISVFYLDCKMQAKRRLDIMGCIKMKPNELKSTEEESSSSKKLRKPKLSMQLFFSKYYTPFLFKKYVRPFVIIMFTVVFAASLVFMTKIEYGLDMNEVFPDDSYQAKYLLALSQYSDIGTPVSVVIRDGYNYTDFDSINRICSLKGCSNQSLAITLSELSKLSNITYLSIPDSNWIDDYIRWNLLDTCCKVDSDKKICALDEVQTCTSCPTKLHCRPAQDLFSAFISNNPSSLCPFSGKAKHERNIYFSPNNSKRLSEIQATSYITYSTVLRNSDDFINAIKSHRLLSSKLSEILLDNSNLLTEDSELSPVFLYSVFHVYYEQYIGLLRLTVSNLLYSIIGVFVCVMILLSFDIQSSLVVLVTLITTMAELMGAMYLFNIKLNAISLVNLVMDVGVAVEFFVHIARDFSLSSESDSITRAKHVIEHVGLFIFIGVSLSELVSIFTMSFAQSKLFRTYFFKMYAILIVTCTIKSLVFLPVFLSYCGPKRVHSEETEMEINDLNTM
ncbi:hypothetical protein GJ496_003888 [Pomphorhynchus laevis]|nr:hypothetical protein GJ496_003888 [Pomphorhynchus laevis]